MALIRSKLAARADGVVRKLGGLPPHKHFYHELSRMRPWSPEDVIFDVGANDGRTVRTLMALLPAPRIFAFEPVAATREVLRQATRRWPNVSIHPCALGAEPGSADIHLHDLAVMNSFVTAPEGGGGMETVEIRTVDGMMRESGVERVDFLKVDTEGFELEVLKGASEALSQGRIGIIQLEFHLTAAEGLQRLHAFLAPHGYELLGLYNQTQQVCRDGDGASRSFGFRPKRLGYADAVYLLTGNAASSDRLALY